jgi:hypothetical protein
MQPSPAATVLRRPNDCDYTGADNSPRWPPKVSNFRQRQKLPTGRIEDLGSLPLALSALADRKRKHFGGHCSTARRSTYASRDAIASLSRSGSLYQMWVDSPGLLGHHAAPFRRSMRWRSSCSGSAWTTRRGAFRSAAANSSRCQRSALGPSSIAVHTDENHGSIRSAWNFRRPMPRSAAAAASFSRIAACCGGTLTACPAFEAAFRCGGWLSLRCWG